MIALLAAALLAQAKDDYEDHLGLGAPSVRVTGSLTTELWYDDNILLSRRDEQNDFITILVPELHVHFGQDDDSYLKIDYRGRDRHYTDFSRFNGMEHYADGTFHYATDMFRIDIWNGYQSRNDAFSVPGQTRRLDWLQNDTSATFAVDLGSFAFELSGDMRRLELFDSAFSHFDHRRWRGALLAAYDVSERLQAIAEYALGVTTYDDEGLIDDFEFSTAAGGVRGALSDDLDLTLKAGFFRVVTDDGSGVVATKNDSAFYAALALVWRPSEDGTLRLEYQHRPIESIYTGWALVQRVEASYAHRVGARVTVSAGGWFETAKESVGGEDRSGYGANAGLEVQATRHLAFTFWGEWRTKDSDDHTFEYDNLRALAGVTVGW